MARVSEWKKVWVRADESNDYHGIGQQGRQSSLARDHDVDGSFFGSMELKKPESSKDIPSGELNQAAAEVLICWFLDATSSDALAQYLEKRKERRQTVSVFKDMLILLRDGSRLAELCKRAGLSKGLEASADDSDHAKILANFKILYKACAKMGIRGEYILRARDVSAPPAAADVHHILLCLVVFARALEARGVEPPSLRGSTLSLDAKGTIVLRPSKENDPSDANSTTIVDVVAHPKLEEMRMKGAFWVPDSFSSKCLICKSSFHLFRRRHHCRSCGLLVCGSCSKHVGRCLGFDESQRLCTVCSKTKTQRLIANAPHPAMSMR